MKTLNNTAVGAKHRGSNALISNREVIETAERLNTVGSTLRVERLFQQPASLETVANKLGFAGQAVREIEVVAWMMGPSRQLPETKEEMLTLYTNHTQFRADEPICDEVFLKDAAAIFYSSNAQVMGFRFVGPADRLVSDNSIKRKLDRRLQSYCREYTDFTGFDDLKAKVTGLVRKSPKGKWPCSVLIHADGPGHVLGGRSGNIQRVHKFPGAVALLHDRKLLGRCAEPSKCKMCIEGKEHTCIRSSPSNN